MKNWLKVAALAVLVAGLSGCSHIKRYSVESYQGLLPAEDHAYLYSD